MRTFVTPWPKEQRNQSLWVESEIFKILTILKVMHHIQLINISNCSDNTQAYGFLDTQSQSCLSRGTLSAGGIVFQNFVFGQTVSRLIGAHCLRQINLGQIDLRHIVTQFGSDCLWAYCPSSLITPPEFHISWASSLNKLRQMGIKQTFDKVS